MLQRENRRRREAIYAKLRYVIFGMFALTLAVYAISTWNSPSLPPPSSVGMDTTTTKTDKTDKTKQPGHHLVFLAVSSKYLAEATFPAFHAAPTVYGPLDLSARTRSVAESAQYIVENIKLHDPQRYRAGWKTGVILMPAMENTWFWGSVIGPLIQHLTQEQGCRISFVGLREYLPYTIVRGLSNCDATALKRKIETVIDQARIFDSLQSHNLQIDRIEPLLNDSYLMERWLMDDVGVYPVNVGPLNSADYIKPPPKCVATALASTLKYIAGLSLTQVQALPALPHLGLWQWEYQAEAAKIVSITQVRNVAATLPSFLHSLDWIADHIILLDTGSTDDTMAVASNTSLECGLTLLHVPPQQSKAEEWHEGQTYRQMLVAARGMGATHILCPDSDEYLTHNWRHKDLLRHMLFSLPRGVGLRLRRFHVYHGLQQWIQPKPAGWQQMERATIGWADDGTAHRATKAKHHTTRMPGAYRKINLNHSKSLGLVHFKFASRIGMLVKTIWYQHLEWKQGNKKRASGSFYAQKIPKVSARHLQTVPTDAWFGPEAEALHIWVRPEIWAWRLRMIHEWRQEDGGTTFPFDLPKELQTALGLVSAPPVNDVNVVQETDRLEPVDLACQTNYKESQIQVTEIGSRSLTDTHHFFWATCDNRILGWLTKHETHVRHFVQRQYASEPDGRLVLDVGANSGFYGLWGLAAGYQVIFIEPQPYCAWMLDLSLKANPGFQQRAGIIRATAGNQTQDPSPAGLPVWCGMTCIGLLGGPGVYGKGKADARRGSVRLDDVVKPSDPQVAFLKIDTEGAETGVLQGAHRLFASHQIKAAVIEVSPKFYKRRRKEESMRQQILIEMLWIHAQGYGIFRPRMAHPRDSVRDYQLLETPMQMRSFFMGRNNAFVQYDVFVVLPRQ